MAYKNKLHIESGYFTLNFDGTAATGGVLINPGINPTLVITTLKRLKLWHGTAIGVDAQYSIGTTDGVNTNCVVSADQGNNIFVDTTNCIYFADAANGWRGTLSISDIPDSSYKIIFFQTGFQGLSLTCQWHGIME